MERSGTMDEWKKTSCALCGQNCGLEVITEGNKIRLMTNYCESMSMDGTLSSMGYKPE
jgi:hypothetical protein